MKNVCGRVTVYLCYILSGLPEGFKDLFVVLQVDVCEHVSSHFVSFTEISLQTLIIDFTLKLCYHRARLNQADTEEREEVRCKHNQILPNWKQQLNECYTANVRIIDCNRRFCVKFMLLFETGLQSCSL